MKTQQTPTCKHKDREWRGPNWTCIECGHVKRQANVELDGVKFKIKPTTAADAPEAPQWLPSDGKNSNVLVKAPQPQPSPDKVLTEIQELSDAIADLSEALAHWKEDHKRLSKCIATELKKRMSAEAHAEALAEALERCVGFIDDGEGGEIEARTARQALEDWKARKE